MSHPIDQALIVLEALRSARRKALEYRIASANSLLDGAQVVAAPHVQARRLAIATRIARGVAATLANRRMVVALGAVHHARLSAQAERLLTRVGQATSS